MAEERQEAQESRLPKLGKPQEAPVDEYPERPFEKARLSEEEEKKLLPPKEQSVGTNDSLIHRIRQHENKEFQRQGVEKKG